MIIVYHIIQNFIFWHVLYILVRSDFIWLKNQRILVFVIDEEIILYTYKSKLDVATLEAKSLYAATLKSQQTIQKFVKNHTKNPLNLFMLNLL